jgi:hypothetical protein
VAAASATRESPSMIVLTVVIIVGLHVCFTWSQPKAQAGVLRNFRDIPRARDAATVPRRAIKSSRAMERSGQMKCLLKNRAKPVPRHQQRQRTQLPRGPRHAHQQRACFRAPMAAAACPIAATFAGADSVGAAPASESPAAATAAITIERIRSLLGSSTNATLAGRRDRINRLVDAATRRVPLRCKRSLTPSALEHGPFRRDRSTLWKIVEWRMLSAANRDRGRCRLRAVVGVTE